MLGGIKTTRYNGRVRFGRVEGLGRFEGFKNLKTQEMWFRMVCLVGGCCGSEIRVWEARLQEMKLQSDSPDFSELARVFQRSGDSWSERRSEKSLKSLKSPTIWKDPSSRGLCAKIHGNRLKK